MENEEKLIREQICEIGENLWTLGFVAANDGNISAMLKDGSIITTPTGVSKKKMTPEMLIKMTTDYEIIDSPSGLRPSSEFKMHLRCYKERPDIRAVVHAHPPVATAYAAAHIALDDYAVSEAVMFLGSVPVAPFAVPGSDAVPESIVPFLPFHDAVLLANHGALTLGADLTQAYFRMETLEHYAKTALAARLLGGAKEIPPEQAKECCDLAGGYPIRHPGYRKYNL